MVISLKIQGSKIINSIPPLKTLRLVSPHGEKPSESMPTYQVAPPPLEKYHFEPNLEEYAEKYLMALVSRLVGEENFEAALQLQRQMKESVNRIVQSLKISSSDPIGLQSHPAVDIEQAILSITRETNPEINYQDKLQEGLKKIEQNLADFFSCKSVEELYKILESIGLNPKNLVSAEIHGEEISNPDYIFDTLGSSRDKVLVQIQFLVRSQEWKMTNLDKASLESEIPQRIQDLVKNSKKLPLDLWNSLYQHEVFKTKLAYFQKSAQSSVSEISNLEPEEMQILKELNAYNQPIPLTFIDGIIQGLIEDDELPENYDLEGTLNKLIQSGLIGKTQDGNYFIAKEDLQLPFDREEDDH